jgi:hypothetical protein
MVVKKKMGRPAGVKNKAALSPVGFKHVAEDEARLTQLIELQRMVKSLEHQAIGYRAVISYLEHAISSSIDT